MLYGQNAIVQVSIFGPMKAVQRCQYSVSARLGQLFGAILVV